MASLCVANQVHDHFKAITLHAKANARMRSTIIFLQFSALALVKRAVELLDLCVIR